MSDKEPSALAWVDKTVDSKLLLLIQRGFILALVPFIFFFARYSWDLLLELQKGNITISAEVLQLRAAWEGETRNNALIHTSLENKIEAVNGRLIAIENTRYREVDAARDFAPRDQRLKELERRLELLESRQPGLSPGR